MKIREATPRDISQIIQVLKASMGEADLPLSEEIWQYKHVSNPFGRSPVFIAEEDGRIAGVRAFMQWEWQKGEKKYFSYRAVDTATHPDFQGKGIFKKLTLKAVEYGINNNYNFVFNTPNDKSRPGYLKMGWFAAGNLKVALQPAFFSFWRLKKISEYEVLLKASSGEIDALCMQWNIKLKGHGKAFTSKSAEFLNWRYHNNPLQKYEVIATPDFYLAGYVKMRGNVKELRISECIFNDRKEVRKEVVRIVRRWSIKFGVHVISFSPDLYIDRSFAIKGKFGPILTVRELNLNPEERAYFGVVDNWNYSLGDLELF